MGIGDTTSTTHHKARVLVSVAREESMVMGKSGVTSKLFFISETRAYTRGRGETPLPLKKLVKDITYIYYLLHLCDHGSLAVRSIISTQTHGGGDLQMTDDCSLPTISKHTAESHKKGARVSKSRLEASLCVRDITGCSCSWREKKQKKRRKRKRKRKREPFRLGSHHQGRTQLCRSKQPPAQYDVRSEPLGLSLFQPSY